MPKFNKEERVTPASNPAGIHKPPRAHHSVTHTQRAQRYIDGRVVAGTVPPARQLGHTREFVPAVAPTSTPTTVHTQTFIPAAAATPTPVTGHTRTFIPAAALNPPGFIPPARVAGTSPAAATVHQRAFVPTPGLTPALFLAATQAPLLGQLATPTPPTTTVVTQTTTRLQPPGRR